MSGAASARQRPVAAGAVRRSSRASRARATAAAAADAAPATSPLDALSGLANCVHAQQFDRPMLEAICEVAEEMEGVRRGTPASKALEGCIMATLFYEPSTRTRLSFEAAMLRLGGSVITTESATEFSSAAKGETLEDTMRTVESYSDVIVLRHFIEGSAERAAGATDRPLINAGDGPGQHPTQALLDVYTIKKEVGRLDNITVGLVGDLLNGRTVRSLAYLLSKFDNIKLIFISPDVCRMRDDIKEFLTGAGVEWEEATDLLEVSEKVDVLYQTRIQKERFEDMESYEAAKGQYVIDAAVMERLPPAGVVMHPLPRLDEIAPEVDADPRAAYFRQANNGLFIRMALLKALLQNA
mmetsp:Transcript_29736/g.96910  ORF Transcript_29736/g.96910 Transcript_29736/m.96910 type:complete len:355 (+) Transcript_29736:44-1108(+)